MTAISYPKGDYGAPLQRWLDWTNSDHSLTTLGEMLNEDAVFFSPVVHTGQKGRGMCIAYLSSAMEVLHDGFRYVDILDQGDRAALIFETEVDGLTVNGLDLIYWNEAGEIIEFKVMMRPLKAVQAVIPKMAAKLESLKG